jgi:hypothetical protein
VEQGEKTLGGVDKEQPQEEACRVFQHIFKEKSTKKNGQKSTFFGHPFSIENLTISRIISLKCADFLVLTGIAGLGSVWIESETLMSEEEERNDKGAGEEEGIPTASFSGPEAGPGGKIAPYKLLSILGEGSCGSKGGRRGSGQGTGCHSGKSA